MSTKPNFYGYSLSLDYRVCCVFVFKGETKRLMGQLTRTAAPKLTREQRYAEQCEHLKSFAITPPAFVATKEGKR